MHTFHPIFSECQEAGVGSKAELFIVEGESALLAVSRIRNLARQAVLAMQGKPLNALKASKKRVESYELYAQLISVIGTGFDTEFDLSKMRYERLIMLFDPDADGIHCSSLLLWFFNRWMNPLLSERRVFMATAPSHQIVCRESGEQWVAFTEDESLRLVDALEDQGRFDLVRVRYRGLASIDSECLAHHCVDPATRRLMRLRVEDAVASQALFSNPRPEMR